MITCTGMAGIQAAFGDVDFAQVLSHGRSSEFNEVNLTLFFFLFLFSAFTSQGVGEGVGWVGGSNALS